MAPDNNGWGALDRLQCGFVVSRRAIPNRPVHDSACMAAMARAAALATLGGTP